MATMAQLATAAAEADAAKHSEEATAAAYEIADLESDVAMTYEQYKELIRREKERDRERKRREKKDREGPQLHGPPFSVPRSFELGAISATYHPKTVRKIVVPRPPRGSYAIPNFIMPLLNIPKPTAAANAFSGGQPSTTTQNNARPTSPLPPLQQNTSLQMDLNNTIMNNQSILLLDKTATFPQLGMLGATAESRSVSPQGSFVLNGQQHDGGAMSNATRSPPEGGTPPFSQQQEANANSSTFNFAALQQHIVSLQRQHQQAMSALMRPEKEPDSDIVILHGLYTLPESIVPLLSNEDAQTRSLINQRVDRLCAPYGVRSQMAMLMKAMFHSAQPLMTAPSPSNGTSVTSPTFSHHHGGGAGSSYHLMGGGTNNNSSTDPFTASIAGGGGGMMGSFSNGAGLLGASSGGRAASFRFDRHRGSVVGGGDQTFASSPNASFAFHPNSGGGGGRNSPPAAFTPLFIPHSMPIPFVGGRSLATAGCDPSSPPTLTTLVEVPTAASIGKGGHWDSATNLKAHIERMEGLVTSLRSALKDLFDTFGDEPLFGPMIGFELNHAIMLWAHVKGRLIARRKMAEFRDRKEFYDEKNSSHMVPGSGGGSGALHVGFFNKNGSSLSLILTASATLARYDGVLGALDYICRNLITVQQFTNPNIVPLTLHYAIARAQANSAVNSGGVDNLNMSFGGGGGFNPTASFRKPVGSPFVHHPSGPGFGAAAGIGPSNAHGYSGGTQNVLIGSHDNAYRISNLVSSLLAALEVFRWEFDVVDESLLTIEAIEAGIRIGLDWLKNVNG